MSKTLLKSNLKQRYIYINNLLFLHLNIEYKTYGRRIEQQHH